MAVYLREFKELTEFVKNSSEREILGRKKLQEYISQLMARAESAESKLSHLTRESHVTHQAQNPGDLSQRVTLDSGQRVTFEPRLNTDGYLNQQFTLEPRLKTHGHLNQQATSESLLNTRGDSSHRVLLQPRLNTQGFGDFKHLQQQRGVIHYPGDLDNPSKQQGLNTFNQHKDLMIPRDTSEVGHDSTQQLNDLHTITLPPGESFNEDHAQFGAEGDKNTTLPRSTDQQRYLILLVISMTGILFSKSFQLCFYSTVTNYLL